MSKKCIVIYRQLAGHRPAECTVITPPKTESEENYFKHNAVHDINAYIDDFIMGHPEYSRATIFSQIVDMEEGG